MTADTLLILISQEQREQGERMAELRRVVSRSVQRIEVLEQQVATLKAAWVASREEGAE
jgi:hypothetical protein